MEHFDVIVIGAGPGGYHAAALLAEKTKKVLIIEKEAIGGTCLNWGCIPTKTLLHLAKQVSYSKELTELGIDNSINYDHTRGLKWKEKVVKTLNSGIESLLKKNKVQIKRGEAKIVELSADNKQVEVLHDKTKEVYSSEKIIIACGLESYIPPIQGISDVEALTSKDILELEKLPTSLLIVGGGVIGVEIAAVYAQLGVKVTVIEALPEILAQCELDSIQIIKKILSEDYNIDIICDARIEKLEKHIVKYTQGDASKELKYDVLLVSTGRKRELSMYVDLGLHTKKTGIKVNDYLETNIPGVYAIGDITGDYQLAHTAYRQAEVVVNNILSPTDSTLKSIRYMAVPLVVYTNPELASCGLTEVEARAKGHDFITASLPITMSGRVIAEHGARAKGYCKIIADKQSTKVLGIHLVGPMVSEIIAVAALILETELRVKELSEIIFPHPTVAEIIHNVALVLKDKIEKN